MLDDLAFGLDLVLPTRGSARGMVVLTEHLHPDEVVGASLPEFVGPYPSPPPVLETTVGIGADAATLYDDSDVNEFAEAIVAQRGLVLSDEDAWVFVRNRHPVLFLLQRESVAGRRALSTSDWVRIRDMLTPNPALSPAADLTARRAALRTWVLETVESVESALAGVRSATDAAAETPPLRTEDLPSLGDTLAAILNYGFGLYFPLATLLPGSDTPEVWTLFRKALYIALDEEVPEADYAKLHLRLRSAFLEALAPGGNWEAFKEAVAPVWIAFNLLLFVVLLASVVGAPEAAVAAEPLAAAATEAAVAEVGILEVIALGVDIVDFYVSWKDLEGALADAEFGDVNRIHALNDFLYSRGLNDLSVIRTVNDDTWDDGLFFAASAIGLWASWDALRRAGRIPPRSAVDVPVTEGAPLALVRLAASRYVSFVEETKDLPKAMLKKTLATDLVQTLSGWASRLVPSWVARTTDARAVRAYSETLAEYEPTVHKFLDHGEPGLFAACHAEKQLALHHVWAGATDPIAITRATCGDCRRFLRAVAQKEGKRVIVADPDWVRSYEPSGKVFIYHHEGDLKTIVDELTAPEAKLFSRTDEVW
ncbi:MAG: hypothetical protein R3B72_49570 [Polyangiaceae bacterium]